MVEDYVVQTMEDVSPPKWHLGHTAWFFEQVILVEFVKDYRPFNERYFFVFNSYYDSFGERVDRRRRGTLSRPTVKEVYDYRSCVDERMQELIMSADDSRWNDLAELIGIGLNHEQQHQELLVTDIKHIFASSPLLPQYFTGLVDAGPSGGNSTDGTGVYVKFPGGSSMIGAEENGFAYDVERPRHEVMIHPFRLQSRLVTSGEYLEFIKDGGYDDARLWLSDGWAVVQERGWSAPLYWKKRDEQWDIITLSGVRPLNPAEPVSHVSFYEAAAFARWTQKRLPTEFEWEVAARESGADNSESNLLETGLLHPRPASREKDAKHLRQMTGDLWEWTASAFLPYPGYVQQRGALGEYNGKFMSNQMVLRGGSCATPRDHIRATYRNFFHCDKRWQFTGIRLADNESS